MGYRELVIADGCSNFWRLGELAGTTAVDLVGGANGTISGGVTLNQTGALADGNKAMVFDGTTGKVQTTANVPLPLICTIEAWMTIASAISVRPVLSTRALPGETGNSVLVGVQGGFPTVHSGIVVIGTRAVANSQWHHMVYVFDGSTVTFYVDGTLDRAQALSRTTPSGGPAAIAFDGNIPADRWPGSIDEVAIYPAALTATQIANHYATGLAYLEVWQRSITVPAAPPGAEPHAARKSTVLPVEPWQRIEVVTYGEVWQRNYMASFAEPWQVRRIT